MLAWLAALSFSAETSVIPTEREFREWMRTYNYVFVGSEYRRRYTIFAANALNVKSHNPSSGFTMALNQFAAYSRVEFSALHPPLPAPAIAPLSGRPLARQAPPDSLDWRISSYVPPVVDAQTCSPWSFAAIVPFSFICFNATGQNITFSAQNLIDCVSTNEGCYSGNVANAYEYLIKAQNGSVAAADDYPLVQGSQSCKYDPAKGLRVLSAYRSFASPADEKELLSAVASYGPVVSAIDASTPEFQLYSAGVFDSTTCSRLLLTQPLVIVGYGTGGEGAFWIAQNSWGATWGEKGYARIKRGSNVCGIATKPLYPVLT
jgi:cathepsin L